MYRLHALAALVDLLSFVALTAAPVPRQRPPEGLTADKVAGCWHYEWGGFPDGVITFAKDGSYVAVHVPGSDQIYAGTWTCDANSVTISEWSYSAATGACRGGPTVYRFDFTGSKYPDLVGQSNGTTRVALARPKD